MEVRHFYEETMVRLHVLADSDESEQQRIKLCVVRAIRQKAARMIRRANSAQEAFELLQKRQRKLVRAARREAARQGFRGAVYGQTGWFEFPDRLYAGQVVPAGRYRALRIMLGTGRGKNWWCVLYPQLCAVEESCAQALSGQEAVHFYSSIWRFLQDLLKGVGM